MTRLLFDLIVPSVLLFYIGTKIVLSFEIAKEKQEHLPYFLDEYRTQGGHAIDYPAYLLFTTMKYKQEYYSLNRPLQSLIAFKHVLLIICIPSWFIGWRSLETLKVYYRRKRSSQSRFPSSVPESEIVRPGIGTRFFAIIATALSLYMGMYWVFYVKNLWLQ
ncbi:MAG: hypothetical protein WDN09_02850 [bacterium]